MKERKSPENWSTWIIGYSYEYGRRRRPVVSFYYHSIAQAIAFLAAQEEFRQGLVFISDDPPEMNRHISGLKRNAQYVSLEALIKKARLSTFTGVDSSNFVFVPCNRRSFPATRSINKIMLWASDRNLPYVYIHDNDHIWFDGFPHRFEKLIFSEFLKTSLFNIPDRHFVISRSNWSLIRRGLFNHGYTLNRALCSCAQGIFTYVLWGGTPENTLLHPNINRRFVSEVSKKLVLALGRDDKLQAEVRSGKCPLTREHGDLAEVEITPGI